MSVIDEILAWAGEKGLALPKTARPDNEPLTLPNSITELELDELGDLYWKFGQETSYIGGELALAETEYAHLQIVLERRMAAKAIELEKDKPKTKRGVEGGKVGIRNEVLVDAEISDLMDQVEIASGRVKFLKAAYDGVRRAQTNISREFSRRGIQVTKEMGGF